MKKDLLTAVSVIALLLAVYSVNRSNLGHSIPDEKRYIQSTKEMIASGDYITPQYHGKLRFQKPIFFYWLIILSYKIFGVTIFGARFPSIIAGVLNGVIAFFIGRNLFNKKAGFLSLLVFAASEISFMYSRFSTPDMTFTLFINAALCSFISAYTSGRNISNERRDGLKSGFRYLYVYVFMALAVITKGPLGFIFPSIAIIIFLCVRRELTILKEMKIALGLLIFLLISAPWFILMIKLHGSEYLGNVWSLEIAKKLNLSQCGGQNPAIHYFGSIFYYFGMTFLRNLPWSVFLPAAIFAIPYCENKKRSFDFLLSWFFAIFAVLALIWSRESYYVLPLSMPIAIFIGLYLARLMEKNALTEKFLFKFPFIFIIVFMFTALVGWIFFISYGLGKAIISPSLLMFLPIGFLIYGYLHRKKKALVPASLIVAAFAFFAYFGGYVISIVDDEPLILFAEDIKAVIKDGDLIAASSCGASYHRLNVYLDEYKVANIHRTSAGSGTIAAENDPLNLFLSTKDKRVFCVVSKDEYERCVPPAVQKRLYIMADALRWKRFDKQDAGYFSKLLSHILRNERELFRQSLKDEIYLVTNFNNCLKDGTMKIKR